MKKFLRKYTPHRSKVNLGWLDKHLQNPCLWNWNRKSISKAFAVGLFCAFLPIPFQMVVAAALAVVFSANILLSVALVWVTNPITMGPIFYFLYKLGCIVLDTQIDPNFTFSWDYLREVIAFPKTQTATDLLFEAPSPVEQSQLDDLHLRIVEPKS